VNSWRCFAVLTVPLHAFQALVVLLSQQQRASCAVLYFKRMHGDSC
jgi:hypothetical protein